MVIIVIEYSKVEENSSFPYLKVRAVPIEKEDIKEIVQYDYEDLDANPNVENMRMAQYFSTCKTFFDKDSDSCKVITKDDKWYEIIKPLPKDLEYLYKVVKVNELYKS